jgi:hypothetical protein
MTWTSREIVKIGEKLRQRLSDPRIVILSEAHEVRAVEGQPQSDRSARKLGITPGFLFSRKIRRLDQCSKGLLQWDHRRRLGGNFSAVTFEFVRLIELRLRNKGLRTTLLENLRRR